ncbi:MAG: gamma-glutamylcyclotransferase [Acidobacteria bacterium]|nr:gamma-glutamylcyclotransferase [Acidobacteriota bacterium]
MTTGPADRRRSGRWVLAYGTLRAPEVVTALLGRSVAARPVRLDGWYPAALEGLDFPVLVEDPGTSCDADLLGPLSADEHELLTRWEGPWYVRAEWEIDGVVATVFLPDLSHPDLPGRTGTWSYETFRSRDLARRLEWMWD